MVQLLKQEFFFFQAEAGIRDVAVTGVQTCALPILAAQVEGNNMHLPIIDLRGHDVEEIHHDYRSYVMRARLERSNGHHDNQVIWTGAAPLVGDATFTASALTVMNKWLAAIEADTSPLPPPA